MQTPSPQPQRLREYTNIWVEIFVAAFHYSTLFGVGIFFPLLPARIPLFMNFNGEVRLGVKIGCRFFECR